MSVFPSSTPGSLGPQPLFKKRSVTKSALRKRPTTPPPESDSSDYSSTEELGRQVKRPRKAAGIAIKAEAPLDVTSSDISATKFAANRSGHIKPTNDATKHSNWFDEDMNNPLTSKSHDTTHAISSEAPSDLFETTYKGHSAYRSFISKNPDAPSSSSRQFGPVKAPTNIRTITVTDFAPDVCKDYKQTGFCGFGDSCKFLHAREDYKQGWELDKDWEIGTKGKKYSGGKKVPSKNDGEDDDDDDDEDAKLAGIPFACIICKESYTNPIVTQCGHYFCEKCALGRYKKNPSCAVCGAGTGGVFNTAKGLKRLLERKRERARKKREVAVANGEEVSEESEAGD